MGGAAVLEQPAATELTKEQKKLLKSIEKGSKATGTMVVEGSEDVKALYLAGKIEAEPVDGDASKAKVWIKGATGQPEANQPGAEPKVEIEIDSDFPQKEAQRGGKKEELYPFSKMKVGDSFLVPVSDKHPKPWESFASTVSSASRRNSTLSTTEFTTNRKGEKIPKRIYTVRYTLRRVTKGDTYPNGKVEPQSGARVHRIS